MENQNAEMQNKIEDLTKENIELKEWKQKYSSQKQSFMRMSIRLKKLCKKLDPSSETVVEMQNLASEIRQLVKEATDS